MRHFYPALSIFGVVGEVRITKELRVSPSDLSELVLSLGGVKFWIVSMVPLYIGWVLARPAATQHLCIDDAALVRGPLVIGPFLGTFTFLVNTYYDMGTTDRVKPRKKYVQVVEELIDPTTRLWAAVGFAGLGILLSWYVSSNFVSFAGADTSGPLTSLLGKYEFALVMGLVVLLGFAYSHPAIRWKGVPGMDLVTNMVGFGILCPLGGGGLRPPLELASWWFFATVPLVLGGGHAPTAGSHSRGGKAG